MRNGTRLLPLLLAAALLLAGCTSVQAAPANNMLRIVCTDFPCYDFARAVSGDRAELTLLIRPGAEVHSYEPSPTDILTIAECDLFIYIGGESDVWVDDILESFGDGAPAALRLIDCVHALSEETREGMTLHEGHAHAADEPEYDEHIWTSPVNAMQMVNAVCEALCRVAPEDAARFTQNAQAYEGEISEIDAAFREVVSGGARREMIFADRFPFLYFVREYGLDYYAAFPSCAAESEPSASTMVFLIDRIARDGVPVIYTIELSNQRTAKVIAEETGAAIRTFYSVQTVSEADFAAGETYVSLMRRNVDVLREGLS